MNEYLTYRLAAFLSRILPERMAYWFGLRIADQFYRRNHKGRQAILSNLARIYAAQGIVPAEEALDGLTRKTFQYFGKYLIDFFRLEKLTLADVRRRVSVEHGEYLDQALGLGKGVVAVTAHLGNWELGGAALAAKGYKINAVVLPASMARVNRLFQSQREKRGMKVIPVGHSVLSIMRCLRRGEIVALLADRDFTNRNDRIEFFGRPARIPLGPAWLAVKTGAPVLPVFLLREVDDTFRIRCHAPILPEEAGSMEAVRERICRVLESEIGTYPYQWYIFDDFWADGEGAGAPATVSHEPGSH